ncbi:mechanosensitive ion channel family protein [Euzebyella saccharophila]|nr:mechanosensitive ion channel domain-containing protein [Euzebyella saccharophila]
MEWKIISNEIGNLLRYLPKLFSGIILFIVGMYIANIVRRAISTLFSTLNLNGSRLIGMAIFYLIAIFFTISALNQAGIDTTIITNNITMILGAFLFALAIGFGFGSKEVIARLLLTFYARKKYRVGDIIEIDGLEGKIESLDNMGVTLAIKNERIIFPIKEVTEKRIIVKKRFVS